VLNAARAVCRNRDTSCAAVRLPTLPLTIPLRMLFRAILAPIYDDKKRIHEGHYAQGGQHTTNKPGH
jgi:hypothetical protein